jgi:hypothetical protein
VWALTEEELSVVFDVSADEIRAWLTEGLAGIHGDALDDLTAATVLLQARLKEGQVAEVVRRPVPKLGGLSLVELAMTHRHAELRQVVEQSFDLRKVQP